ncbi:MAG: hypothetical protein HIU83_12460 [Proteobacteria bacterium]|nr:hypothetical protein [Pseudomonadota bacterium]
MYSYVEFLIILPLLIVCYQLYSFSANSTGVEKQERCLKLGIAFMTFGITALAIRSIPFSFFAIVLIMFGFRLLAKGLDRLDKKRFIDRCEDDELVFPIREVGVSDEKDAASNR